MDRDSLIVAHLPMAMRAASRMAQRRGIVSEDERDEMRADAALGLVRAAARWRPERNIPFKAYAFVCIARSLRNGIRGRRSKIPTVSLEAERQAI